MASLSPPLPPSVAFPISSSLPPHINENKDNDDIERDGADDSVDPLLRMPLDVEIDINHGRGKSLASFRPLFEAAGLPDASTEEGLLHNLSEWTTLNADAKKAGMPVEVWAQRHLSVRGKRVAARNAKKDT
jgi:hypothetical protein